jgi:hypothetical protein
VGRVRKGLIVALAVVLGLAATVGYNFLLDLQLAGYRGRKQVELKKIAKRDEQRPRVAAHVAERDRILAKRFGDLPEALDVRTELELVRTWQTLIAGLFLPFGVGVALYIALARRPSLGQRGLRGAAVLVGAAHALPLLLLPDDALHFFRVFGLPLIIVALIILAVCAVRDRRADRRAESAA